MLVPRGVVGPTAQRGPRRHIPEGAHTRPPWCLQHRRVEQLGRWRHRERPARVQLRVPRRQPRAVGGVVARRAVRTGTRRGRSPSGPRSSRCMLARVQPPLDRRTERLQRGTTRSSGHRHQDHVSRAAVDRGGSDALDAGRRPVRPHTLRAARAGLRGAGGHGPQHSEPAWRLAPCGSDGGQGHAARSPPSCSARASQIASGSRRSVLRGSRMCACRVPASRATSGSNTRFGSNLPPIRRPSMNGSVPSSRRREVWPTSGTRGRADDGWPEIRVSGTHGLLLRSKNRVDERRRVRR